MVDNPVESLQHAANGNEDGDGKLYEYTLLLKDETARDEKVRDASPFHREKW